MKPLTLLFVDQGFVAIKENCTIEAICRTFQDRCVLGIARSQETYALALPGDIDLIEVPAEVEEEKDLGPVAFPTPPVVY